MGGRALSVAYTRRYALEEYLRVQDELVELLSNDFNEVAVPLYYRDKNTFGDLDIILSWPKDTKDLKRGEWIRKYIEDTFEPKEIYHTKNSNSWSFHVEELQVDFIMCDEADFDCYYHYFSYNDLGNLIGRLAHSLGFKYGQEGLVYDHYFRGEKLGRITVSKDYPRIFEFLDLDYARWEKGFDKLEEVFDFVLTSKYFHYEKYQLRALNKINRERNLKRDSYMRFLDYIEDHKHRLPQQMDKDESIKRGREFFPEFQYVLETRRMEYVKTKQLYIQAKFNGGEIKKRFGLEGKELGEAINMFKSRLEDEFEVYILEMEIEDIYSQFGGYLEGARKNR